MHRPGKANRAKGKVHRDLEVTLARYVSECRSGNALLAMTSCQGPEFAGGQGQYCCQTTQPMLDMTRAQLCSNAPFCLIFPLYQDPLPGKHS